VGHACGTKSCGVVDHILKSFLVGIGFDSWPNPILNPPALREETSVYRAGEAHRIPGP